VPANCKSLLSTVGWSVLPEEKLATRCHEYGLTESLADLSASGD